MPTRHPLDIMGSISQVLTSLQKSCSMRGGEGAEAERVGQSVARQCLDARWVLGCGTQAEILKVILRGELERG